MNRYFPALLFPLFFLFSCAPKQDLSDRKVPDKIIQPDSMVDIIVDMQLAEGILREMKQTGKYEQDAAITSFERVFSKYNINKEEYDESIAYYEQNLDVYQKIYESVITRLSQIQTETNIPKDEEYDWLHSIVIFFLKPSGKFRQSGQLICKVTKYFQND